MYDVIVISDDDDNEAESIIVISSDEEDDNEQAIVISSDEEDDNEQAIVIASDEEDEDEQAIVISSDEDDEQLSFTIPEWNEYCRQHGYDGYSYTLLLMERNFVFPSCIIVVYFSAFLSSNFYFQSVCR